MMAFQYFSASSIMCPTCGLFSNLTRCTLYPFACASSACASTSSHPTILSALLYKYTLGVIRLKSTGLLSCEHNVRSLFSLPVTLSNTNIETSSRCTSADPKTRQTKDLGSEAEIAAWLFDQL